MPPLSRASRSSNRSLKKTKVIINVYDLLPPGRLSTFVWAMGVGLLHSGVVIGDREYAFGGHDRRGLTGVYWTKPRTEPPGGTFRSEILHGFTYASNDEIEDIVREASNEFLGPSYNLLTRNCNHFTSHLCMALTGQPAPAYLNRAASIGVALPCVVPAGWVEPPECDVGDEDEQARLTSNAASTSRRHSVGDTDAWGSSGGEYNTDEDEEERQRERRRERERKKIAGVENSGKGKGRSSGGEYNTDEEEEERQRKRRRERERKKIAGVENSGKGRRSGELRDTGGRELPRAERARFHRTLQ